MCITSSVRMWEFRLKMRIRIFCILMYRYLAPWDSYFRDPFVFDIWWLAMNSDNIAVQMRLGNLGIEVDHICDDYDHADEEKKFCFKCMP